MACAGGDRARRRSQSQEKGWGVLGGGGNESWGQPHSQQIAKC